MDTRSVTFEYQDDLTNEEVNDILAETVNIKYIYFRHCIFKDTIIIGENLPFLRSVEFDHVTGHGIVKSETIKFAMIKYCNNIEFIADKLYYLCIDNNDITDESMCKLYKGVSYLEIINCPNLKGTFLKELPELYQLRLENQKLGKIFKRNIRESKINSLLISGNVNIRIVNMPTTLLSLYLKQNRSIKFNSLQKLNKMGIKLKRLTIDKNYNIRNLPLYHLDCQYVVKIKMFHRIKTLKNLKFLHMITNVPEKYMEGKLAALKNLKIKSILQV